MPVDAVLQPLQRRLREVLAHRQRVDVAEPTVIEIARRGMVHRMRALPVGVRRHRQHAQARAHEVGGLAGLEERAVAAVVLNDEQPDQHEAGRHRQQERHPVGKAQAGVHQPPAGHEERQRARELPDATGEIRVAEWRQASAP